MEMKKRTLFLIWILCQSIQGLAQATMGLRGNAPAGGPSGMGPSTDKQIVTLYLDSVSPSNPVVTATYTLSHQQYTSIEGHPNTPGIVFGSTIIAGSNAIAPDLLYPLMNSYGGQAGNYTACHTCTSGTGLDMAADHAIQIQTFTDALIDASGANLKPVDAKVWFADLTINFNIPVSNPVFHFTGLGAWVYKSYATNGSMANYDLGISAELDLLTAGYHLSKLSGSPAFDVSGTTIRNKASYFGDGNTIHGISRSSASGSAVLHGTNISTVTFRISLRGDGGIIVDNAGARVSAAQGRYVAWSLADNISDPSAITTAGDGFLVGISLMAPEAQPGNVLLTAKEKSRQLVNIRAYRENETISIFPLEAGDLIELTDVAGKTVIGKVALNDVEVIKTHALAAGLYTVNIYSSGHKEKHRQKVIKQ